MQQGCTNMIIKIVPLEINNLNYLASQGLARSSRSTIHFYSLRNERFNEYLNQETGTALSNTLVLQNIWSSRLHWGFRSSYRNWDSYRY